VVVASETSWPSTLLEHTAIASGQWAPTPRNRLEKLQLTQTPTAPRFLGSRQEQVMYHRADMQGGASDTSGSQRENDGRLREPQSNHFDGVAAPKKGDLTPHKSGAGLPLPSGSSSRAPRKICKQKGGCSGKKAPVVVPPPGEAPHPLPDPRKPAPGHEDYPQPPAPSFPPATPPHPGCNGLCNPNDSVDSLLVRVPHAPLSDLAQATVGLEGEELAKVEGKIENRSQWLASSKEWLQKAVEAASVLRTQLELAEITKESILSDLNQLKLAQDHLSIRYKATQLKWAFKDNKATLEDVHAKFKDLEHAKADVEHKIREAKDDVIAIENTLGKPSEQVQITPRELEDPLKFLEDVTVDEFGVVSAP